MKVLIFCVFFTILHVVVSTELVSVHDEQARVQQMQEEIQLRQLEGRESMQEQMREQLRRIFQQQQQIAEQAREERLRQEIEADSLKVHVLPDTEDEVEEVRVNMEYVGLSNQPSISSKNSRKLTIPRSAFTESSASATGSHRKQAATSSEWGEFSCCRRSVGLQTRERMANSRYLQAQPRECSWNYCEDCVDDIGICSQLRDIQNACDSRSTYRGFMSSHCPQTCDWCSGSSTSQPITTTTTASTPPPVPTIDPNLRHVRVHFNDQAFVYIYKFTTSPAQPQLPWKQMSRSIHPGEVDSFFLYARATGQFRMPVYFCKARHGNTEKWIVIRRPCYGGWRLDMKLYGSATPLPETELLFFANRGQSPWTSRIFKNAACCGYEKSVWNVYTPIPSRNQPPDATRIPNSPLPPRTTARTTTPARTTTTRAPSRGPTSPYHRECLEYHNFFRAIHDVPALQWDSALTTTSQRWADYLADAAPLNPFIIGPEYQRTKDWPHSNKSTQYRGRGVGENIAWDFSGRGSPAKESVLRWYAEIFDYDERNPTHSAQGKPVGHYTQMLWKESTYVGCSVAIRNVRKRGYTYKSTYAVAHYAPGGNVRYRERSQTLAAYTRNVPRPISGSCMSPTGCSEFNNNKNRCMGFSRNMNCACASGDASVFGGRPRCTGSGGCMVSCNKPPQSSEAVNYLWESECQGQRSCECIYTPRDGRAGAFCT